MPHLNDEEVLLAAVGSTDLSAECHGHTVSCAQCTARVAGMSRVAFALAESEPEPAVPSFDALVSPVLDAAGAHRRESPAPDPDPLTMTSAVRLTAALVLRQVRIIPTALWPLTALGFAGLLAFAWSADAPAAGAVLFGPGITLLITLTAMAVTSPRRDPRAEVMYTMRVQPSVVWLARLGLVLGINFAAAAGISTAAAAGAGAPADATVLIASWLGPALIGVALTVFGSVWKSPVVGTALGAGSWLASLMAARSAPEADTSVSGVRDTLGAVWTTTPVSLALATALLCAAVWLVSRPDRLLQGD